MRISECRLFVSKLIYYYTSFMKFNKLNVGNFFLRWLVHYF